MIQAGKRQIACVLHVRLRAPKPEDAVAVWSDVLLVEQPEPVISYRTGWVVYEKSVVSGIDPHDWGVLELAAADRSRDICGLFQLSALTQLEYKLRFRGLDLSRRYRVTFDNSGQTTVLDGFTLMEQDITVRLEGVLTSELIMCEAE